MGDDDDVMMMMMTMMMIMMMMMMLMMMMMITINCCHMHLSLRVHVVQTVDGRYGAYEC